MAYACNLPHERVVLVRSRTNTKSIVLHAEPCPAGTKTRRSSLGKFRFHRIERTKIAVDRRSKITGGSGSTARGDDFPEQAMVKVTTTVVTDRSLDICRNLIEVLDQRFYGNALEVVLAQGMNRLLPLRTK